MSESAISPIEQNPNQFPEILFNPQSVAIVTGTFYPNWYKGDVREPLSSDKLRGDLALESFHACRENNFRLIVIDGGSSTDFQETLRSNDITFFPQEQKGGSGPARRQGIKYAQTLNEVKVIGQTEPEKISIFFDCAKIASLPILRGEADIVMPSRYPEGFSTYPKLQAEQEQKANKLYNAILRRYGLLKTEDRDLDIYWGQSFFANKPEITILFENIYQYRKDKTSLDKWINVDMYSGPLYFPIIEALHLGLEVKSVTVPYFHPQSQTSFEEGKPEFDKKRYVQRRTIITELVHYIRLLQANPNRPSRLSKINL